MIASLHQVMLYVDNQQEVVKFWTEQVGFEKLAENELPEGYQSVEIAPHAESETSLVIFDKAFIKKYSPMVSLETPSLMFNVNNADDLYQSFKEKGITVGELTAMPNMKVFNFCDPDENYFAVMEQL
ncbi:VOC family protein [Macrococcus hajekii]|uniref:VOC family protein n=1 Tax=Macrococcus hajekii TaxID=198482 RepID=A0A4R6BJ45_9STAP|nr:VOC family protein [Macrococcus hajekii]TDM01712.1 VOC family protein [Macrococcus hajekii]GGB06763.1 lactoylglutathione lyase [Macrococcus hajekii]